MLTLEMSIIHSFFMLVTYVAVLCILFPGNNLLYLDPHTTQQAVNPEKMSQIPDEVFLFVEREREQDMQFCNPSDRIFVVSRKVFLSISPSC